MLHLLLPVIGLIIINQFGGWGGNKITLRQQYQQLIVIFVSVIPASNVHLIIEILPCDTVGDWNNLIMDMVYRV